MILYAECHACDKQFIVFHIAAGSSIGQFDLISGMTPTGMNFPAGVCRRSFHHCIYSVLGCRIVLKVVSRYYVELDHLSSKLYMFVSPNT